jgi:hypothetical protein
MMTRCYQLRRGMSDGGALIPVVLWSWGSWCVGGSKVWFIVAKFMAMWRREIRGGRSGRHGRSNGESRGKTTKVS